MGRTQKARKVVKTLEFVCSILPMAFWMLILFSFEEFFLAINTLLCALIHELGHLICIFCISRNFHIRSVINGFRIKPQSIRSYDEEILIYLSGPLANVSAFVVFTLLSILVNSSLAIFAIINLATAISNLLPIKGYDGYGTIRAIINKREHNEGKLKALSILSSALIFAFCVFSLYLIDRYGGGYWIFAVFFISMLKEIKEGLEE